MKYQPPTEGKYEDSLTARLLYDTMNALLKTYVHEPQRKAILKKYKSVNFQPTVNKLWETESVRGNLDTFVNDYFFLDLEQRIPWLREALDKNRPCPPLAFREYFADYGNLENEIKAEITEILDAFKIRYEVFIGAHKGLKSLADIDIEVLDNAIDGFGHMLASRTVTKRVLDTILHTQS